MAARHNSTVSSIEESTTLSDIGFTPQPTTQDSIFGTVRVLSSLSCLEVTFLIATTISILVSIGLGIWKLVQLDNFEDVDSIFALVLIINALFCVYYIFHGVFWERPYEIVVYVVGVVVVTVYLIINFVKSTGWKDEIKIARLVAVAVLGPVTVVIGIILTRKYSESGNLIFRTVGATEDLQKACKSVFITEALIKLDLQVESNILILILQSSRFQLIKTTFKIVILSVGFPFSIVWAFFGFLMLRFEKRIGIILFILAGLCEPAYVIFLMTEVAKLKYRDDPVLTVTLACGGIALLMRLLVIIGSIACMRNFGLGLKEKIAPKIFSNYSKRQATSSSFRNEETSA